MKNEKQLITCSAGNDVAVWKSDAEDFGYNTEVVVPYSHEAIFVKDGKVLETLCGGRYTLNEQSTSFFAGLFKKKETRFSCAIYFINKSVNLKIRWGTASPLNLFDSMLKIPVRVGAHGEFEVRVENTLKFFTKVVGNTSKITAEGLQEYFREQLLLYIKDAVASAMITDRIGFYEVDTQLLRLSKTIRGELSGIFAGYGVSLESFILSGVTVPEEVKAMLEREYYEQKKLEIRGTSYREERSDAKDTLKTVLNAAVAVEGNARADGKYCPACGAKVTDGSSYCFNCGKSLANEPARCPMCNREVAADSKFCNHCGKKI